MQVLDGPELGEDVVQVLLGGFFVHVRHDEDPAFDGADARRAGLGVRGGRVVGVGVGGGGLRGRFGRGGGCVDVHCGWGRHCGWVVEA